MILLIACVFTSLTGNSNINIFFRSTEGNITGIMLLLCVLVICICCKYKVSCQKRNQFRCCSDALHSSESVNSSQQDEQGETHEYEEVVAGVRNSELSNMSDQDVGSSSSMTGSGICGTDSDGYLNPYHTPQSIPITFEHGPYSDISNTATSVLHVLESQVFFKSQK